MNRLIRFLILLGAPAAALTAWYSASSIWMSGPIEARVVDASTGQPVGGAVVLANWELKGLEGWVVGQLALFEVVTDEQGVFRIPKWGPLFHTGGGTIRGISPEVRVFDRRYWPIMLRNSTGRPSEETYLWTHFRKPRLDGQTVRLQPFDGTALEYANELQRRLLLQSVEFLYTGRQCEWRRAPRTIAALHGLRTEVGDAAIGIGLHSVDDMHDPWGCGSPQEFLKKYLQ
jgi:hypothetical protein